LGRSRRVDEEGKQLQGDATKNPTLWSGCSRIAAYSATRLSLQSFVLRTRSFAPPPLDGFAFIVCGVLNCYRAQKILTIKSYTIAGQKSMNFALQNGDNGAR
jgi:hypothetical protein